jgi:hypothetical protein
VRIGLIACSKSKSDRQTAAGALYTSALFRKSLLAAVDASDKVFVLSALHGVLPLNEQVEPYDVTLKTMGQRDRMAWGNAVAPQLAEILRARDTALLYCGKEYLAPILPKLDELGVAVETPLGTRSLGHRLQYLAQINDEKQLFQTAARFQHLIRRLWAAQAGGRRIDETTGRLPWPNRGVYFILDSQQGPPGNRVPRIVRVGTHAVSAGSRTTLWDRLSTHRGTGEGSGSHRSSIFRLHVGRARMRERPSADWPISWAEGQSAPRQIRDKEQMLEREVSGIIGAMRVLWLDIPDEAGPSSERAYIERNAIGLLSRTCLLKGTGKGEWLGRYSADWRISVSGLWNLNHIFMQPDLDFIDRFEAAVNATIGSKERKRDNREGVNERQLSFLGGVSINDGSRKADQGECASNRSPSRATSK